MSTTEDTAPPGTGTELVAVETAADQIEQAPDKAVATYADVTAEGGSLRAVISEEWRRENIRATIRQHTGKHWHRTKFHGVRAPLYGTRTLGYALRGAGVLLARITAWWHCTGLWVLESQAVAAGRAGHQHAMQAHTQGIKTRAARGKILAVCVVALAAGLAAAAVYGPWWEWPPALAALAVVLARHGRPEGRRIVGAAVVPQRFEPPTFALITEALANSVPAIRMALKNGAVIDYIVDVHPDGPGWGCVANLPRGVTATEVIKRRPELSAAGHWPLSATWPSGVPEAHEGQLELWIGRQDLSKAPKPPWPLLKAGQSDVFGAVPFATDPRGRSVRVPLFEVNWIFGASPGQGKTASVRVLACAVALDPIADMWIHELAGKGDLDLSRVCHRYTSGIDDESIEHAAESARMLRQETERRSVMFKKLKNDGVMPDGKVTRELARKYRALRPLVAFFDEVQNLFMHPELGKQAAADLAFAIRVGRAMGITVVLATQRPNAESVPPTVSGLIICRFCLMVPGQVENDMVLGTSAYKNGYKATELRPKVDAGLGWLKGSEDGIPQIARAYYLDLKVTARIVERARGIRQQAGVLTGYALGEADGADARDVLADVLSVFREDSGLHWTALAGRLAAAHPERWADATGDAVSAQCRDLGVPTRQVKADGRNLRGCRRLDVESARAGHA